MVRTLEETATQFEADIPWSQSAEWPENVQVAAEALVRASGKTHADEPYQQTGMLRRADEAVWLAFTTFAGYAYDASVWTGRPLPLVSVADEGTSLVIRVDEIERERLQSAIHPIRLSALRRRRIRRRP